MVNSISHLHLNTIHLKMNFDENILTAFPMENTATHLIAEEFAHKSKIYRHLI